MPHNKKNPANTNPERFWSKVEVRGANDCWLWTAATAHQGYGKLWWGPKCEGAHRISYMLEHDLDELPKKIDGRRAEIIHSCDNPPCVNPKHLRLATTVDNQRDKTAKGRHHLQTRKTCNHGHPWTIENTGYIRCVKSEVDGTPFNTRYCKTCHSKRLKKSYRLPSEQNKRKSKAYKERKNELRRKLYAERHPNAKLRGPMPRKKKNV
jgi:hypothetical protein